MAVKELTYDQKKAAEAAFRGLPFDPAWSAAARAIYDGIVKSTNGRSIIDDPELAEVLRKVAALPVSGEMPASSDIPAMSPSGSPVREADSSPAVEPKGQALPVFGVMTRQEAVQAGILVDVTEAASQVGISLPVGLTRPLWETGITAGDQIPEEYHQSRVHDLLVALRLFLEQAPVTSPLMEFPALISFSQDEIPQVTPLFVLAHREESSTPYSLTVLLPREVSLIKILPGK